MIIGSEEAPFRRFGDDKYKVMAELGFKTADYSLARTDHEIYAMPEDQMKVTLLKEKELAEANGVKIFQTHGPWRWPVKDSTEENRAERMEKMKKSIDMTVILGAKNWVIHPIMPFGDNDIGTEKESKTWEMNKVFMTEILQYAKEKGVTICFENMPMRNLGIGAPDEILRFVKEMNDENFKICLDIGHAAIYYKTISVGDVIRKMGKEIRCLHVHDNCGWVDDHNMPLDGIVDWQDTIAAFKEVGYEGAFSLETTPSSRLDDDIFLELCRIYYKVTKSLLG